MGAIIGRLALACAKIGAAAVASAFIHESVTKPATKDLADNINQVKNKIKNS